MLGLQELTKLEKIKKLINEKKPGFDYKDILLTDKKTLNAFAKGQAEDVFQFESPGMKKILRICKPERFEDLAALNALYRPGPMDYIPIYIDCKQNPETIHYPDPCLEEILKETYGLIVYQEQLMQVAKKIAGYSLGEADMLRRAMGKKRPEILMYKKKDFVECAMKRGFTEENSSQIYEILIPFAGYGFNKSHAVAYTKMAFWDMYLKMHYNEEYVQVLEESIEKNCEDDN